jgi:UPF0755 protein
MIQRLWVLLLALAVLGAFAVRELRQAWSTPLQIPSEGFVIEVAEGDSLRTVVDTLRAAGVLVHPQLVILYGRWTGIDQQIKRGEYRLPRDSTAESMLHQLQRGDVIRYQVTLPEGITLANAMDILSQQEQLKKILEGSEDPRLLELVKPHTSAEGLFFPDSYHYVRGDSDWSIMQRAHAAMNSVLQEEWHQRETLLPFDTPYEALIMASIIERETGLSEERAQISGVFTRRLQKGMPLQTDPTVIYGLGVEFDGNLQRRHLEEVSNAYNTYRIPGLPPTPIALPGRAAIHAALHPDPGDSLYFVARGDGGHIFSATLTQHNQAVREYQLHRSENYRSTPKKAQLDE